MTDKMQQDEELTVEKWSQTKPEAFSIPDEEYDRVMAKANELYELCEELGVPACFNFVYSQDEAGNSATKGFTNHHSAARTTVEIIMGCIINTSSGAGLAQLLPNIGHFAAERANLINGGSSVIQLLDRDRI